MANEQNLIPVRTESEAREKGRKGGIASGEARRAKKTMAQLAELMLNSKLSEDKKEEIQSQFGDIIDEDATVASMMVAGQIKSAIGGNTKAFNALTTEGLSSLYVTIKLYRGLLILIHVHKRRQKRT